MKVKNTRLKYLKYIAILPCIIIIYVSANAISIWEYSKIDEKCSADVAIVLGASTYHGKVSDVFRERINHAIVLYQSGYIKKLILTGGYGGENTYSDAYAAKLYAESMKVPSKDILYEEKSTTTQENIWYAKKIMEDNMYHTAIVVSDPLHMKRAMRMAKDIGIEAYSSPTPTTKYISTKKKLEFLKREVRFYILYTFKCIVNSN